MTKGHGHAEGKPAKPPYKRQQYWVDAPLQLQMVGFVVLLVASSLLLSAFSVYKGVSEASITSRQIFHSLDWIKESLRGPLTLASAISLLASGLITLFWSHRFAGPLRVISAGIARVRHGNLGVAVRVRDTDAHQDLAKEFQLMQDGLRDMIAADRGHIANAQAHLEKAAAHAHGETKDELEKAQAELKKACAKYHL